MAFAMQKKINALARQIALKMGFFSFTKRKVVIFVILVALGVLLWYITVLFSYAPITKMGGISPQGLPFEYAFIFLTWPFVLLRWIGTNILTIILSFVLTALWLYLLTCLIDLLFRRKGTK